MSDNFEMWLVRFWVNKLEAIIECFSEGVADAHMRETHRRFLETPIGKEWLKRVSR